MTRADFTFEVDLGVGQDPGPRTLIFVECEAGVGRKPGGQFSHHGHQVCVRDEDLGLRLSLRVTR
jgi:hypothetical protein